MPGFHPALPLACTGPRAGHSKGVGPVLKRVPGIQETTWRLELTPEARRFPREAWPQEARPC